MNLHSTEFYDEVYGKEKMIPYSCQCCNKCWFVIESKRRQGRCIHGGPYQGYVEVEDILEK